MFGNVYINVTDVHRVEQDEFRFSQSAYSLQSATRTKNRTILVKYNGHRVILKICTNAVSTTV